MNRYPFSFSNEKCFTVNYPDCRAFGFPRALIGEHQDGSFRGEADGRQQAERG